MAQVVSLKSAQSGKGLAPLPRKRCDHGVVRVYGYIGAYIGIMEKKMETIGIIGIIIGNILGLILR